MLILKEFWISKGSHSKTLYTYQPTPKYIHTTIWIYSKEPSSMHHKNCLLIIAFGRLWEIYIFDNYLHIAHFIKPYRDPVHL